MGVKPLEKMGGALAQNRQKVVEKNKQLHFVGKGGGDVPPAPGLTPPKWYDTFFICIKEDATTEFEQNRLYS